MKRVIGTAASASLSVICAVLIAPPASAQSEGARGKAAPAEADAGMDNQNELVVVARRREERLQDVPITITALSTKMLEERGVVTVADIQRVAPSVTIQPLFGKESTPNIAVRGFKTGQSVLTQDSPVAVYFAEVPVGLAQGTGGSLFDLQSVQVLKGPQGTLFGRNTPGGALLIVPKKPTDEQDGYVKLSYGNFNRISGEGAATVVVSGALKVRLAFSAGSRDGYFHVTQGALAGKDLMDTQSFNARLSAVLDVTDNIENYVVAYYSEDRSNGSIPRLIAINPVSNVKFYTGGTSPIPTLRAFPDINSQIFTGNGYKGNFYTDIDGYDRNKTWGVVNTTTFQLSDSLTLKNIFGYRRVTANSLFDFDGTSALLLTAFNAVRPRTLSEEFQLQGDMPGINWVVGGNFFRQSGTSSSVAPALAGLNPNNVVNLSTKVNNRSYAVFGQGTIDLPVDNLTMTVGGRYTIDKRGATFANIFGNDFPTIVPRRPAGICSILNTSVTPAVPLNPCIVNLNKTFRSFTYNVGLEYKPTDDLLLYVAHRRGYRAGGFNSSAPSVAALTAFDPEIVYDVEAGVKSEFNIGSMPARLNFSAYYAWYNNIQQTVGQIDPATGTLANLVFNAAKAVVPGIDLNLSIEPFSGLTFELSYGYQDPQYRSFTGRVSQSATSANPPFSVVTIPGAPVVVDYRDRKFGSISNHQLSVFLQYSLPIDTALGKVSMSAQYSYRSKFFFNETYQKKSDFLPLYPNAADYAKIPDNVPGLSQKGFGLLDLRINWEKNGLGVSGWVKNVTNKYYSPGGFGALYQQIGYNSVLPGVPRTFGVDLSYRF